VRRKAGDPGAKLCHPFGVKKCQPLGDERTGRFDFDIKKGHPMTGPMAQRNEIDFAKAQAKVAAFIATVRPPGKHPWETRGASKVPKDGFWLFNWAVRSDFWPKRKWAPTVGNNPIAVRKSDGAMFMWNLLCRWEEFVERVKSGDLHPFGYVIEPR
jgi:hypothetical protein